jgi:hypothetical protein
VTAAVAFAMFEALAVIVADPAATPVTGTETLEAPARRLTVEGTVAMAALLELRLIVRAAGVAADRLSVRVCVASPLIARLAGEKLIVRGATFAVTTACELTVG